MDRPITAATSLSTITQALSVQGVLEQVQQPAEGQGGEPQRHQCRSALGRGVLLTGQHDRDAHAGDHERDRHGEHRGDGVERRVAAAPDRARPATSQSSTADRQGRDRGVDQRAETASPWSQVRDAVARRHSTIVPASRNNPSCRPVVVGAGAHDLGEAHCGAHAEDPETERQQGDELRCSPTPATRPRSSPPRSPRPQRCRPPAAPSSSRPSRSSRTTDSATAPITTDAAAQRDDRDRHRGTGTGCDAGSVGPDGGRRSSPRQLLDATPERRRSPERRGEQARERCAHRTSGRARVVKPSPSR